MSHAASPWNSRIVIQLDLAFLPHHEVRTPDGVGSNSARKRSEGARNPADGRADVRPVLAPIFPSCGPGTQRREHTDPKERRVIVVISTFVLGWIGELSLTLAPRLGLGIDQSDAGTAASAAVPAWFPLSAVRPY